MTVHKDIAAVVVGRNEGDRLVECLESLHGQVNSIVYVDSGSTDGSIERARSVGATIVELDLSIPFTAARARNAGFEYVLELGGVQFVQFVDGDCSLQRGWLNAARNELAEHTDVAVVCGRRRERFPETSIYNRLCDAEWDTPIGETKSCGGDALMRVDALAAANGFNPSLIAGEEPELCLRLRQAGWKIHRIDAEMTLHDAAMTRFSQFWKRAQRAGFAAAEGMAMHGAPPEYHGVAAVRRALFWSLAVPAITILMAALATPWAFIILLLYPVQLLRIAVRAKPTESRWEKAVLLMLAKFPEAQGIFNYWWRRLTKGAVELIEYK